MELKIGEIFNFHGIILQVYKAKDSDRCKGCFFENYPLSLCPPHTCIAIGRKDKKNIIFKKLINKMTREEAKELLPIIQAFAEGKTIELYDTFGWTEINNSTFDLPPINYRIKPEPKYRPFKNQEECFDEMMKHKPFGWFRSTYTKNLFNIVCLNDCGIKTTNTLNKYMDSYDKAFDNIKFVDGTPFGIKE